MKKLTGAFIAGLAFLIADGTLKGQVSNIPPHVSIVWPRMDCSDYYNYTFLPGEIVKIKAIAMDPDGSIAQVQFYADTNLIEVVTNVPYTVIWKAGKGGSSAYLRAVATDNSGATTESSSIWVGVLAGSQMPPVFEIVSPNEAGPQTGKGEVVRASVVLRVALPL